MCGVMCRTPKGITAGNIFAIGWAFSTLPEIPGMCKEQLLLDGGWIDACIDLLKAYELGEATDINSGLNPQSIWSCTRSLADLDLTSAAALPIVQKLERIPSALKFLLEHPVSFMVEWGWTTTATACWIFDRAFGKEEGGGSFQLSQQIVDFALQDLLITFSGALLPWNPILSRLFLCVPIYIYMCTSCLYYCATSIIQLHIIYIYDMQLNDTSGAVVQARCTHIYIYRNAQE